ncbi:hypothetical protein L596_011259 [Steinernema carpocapsae]|uniref:Uncharacterized protein n=1 Tax=Steinernema carpocapsae TaxID=34508 RepID=A0A4U5NTV0_STECR|nr:hypothetical protein L596_011259 [Steinernema carpocapsae]
MEGLEGTWRFESPGRDVRILFLARESVSSLQGVHPRAIGERTPISRKCRRFTEYVLFVEFKRFSERTPFMSASSEAFCSPRAISALLF